MMAENREPFELPVVMPKSPKDECIKTTASKCVATTKKVAIDALMEKPTDITALLFNELSDLWDKAYDAGLKDMDRMHQKTGPNY